MKVNGKGDGQEIKGKKVKERKRVERGQKEDREKVLIEVKTVGIEKVDNRKRQR